MKELFEAWNQHLLDEAKEDDLKKKYEKKIAGGIIKYLNRWANESEKGVSLRKQRIKYLPWMYKQASLNPNFQYSQDAYDESFQELIAGGWSEEEIADPELGLGPIDFDHENVELEDINRDWMTLSSNVEDFIKYFPSLPKDKRDINRLKDVIELQDLIWENVHQKRIEKSLAAWQAIDKEDTLLGKVYDNRYTLIRPLTREAAQRFGCTAEWCIGQGGPMFDQYTSEGKVFYYLQDHARKNTGDPYQQITIEYVYPHGHMEEPVINQVWDRYNNSHDQDWLTHGGGWWEAMMEMGGDEMILDQMVFEAERSAEGNPPQSRELMKYEDDDLLNEEMGVNEDNLEVTWNGTYDDGYLYIGGRAKWRIPIKTSFQMNPQPRDEQYPFGLTHPKIVSDQDIRMDLVDLDEKLEEFVQENAYFFADDAMDVDGILSRDESDPGYLFFSYNIYLDERAFDHEDRLQDEIGHMAYLFKDHMEEYTDLLANFCVSKFPQLFDIQTLQKITDMAEEELIGLNNFSVVEWDHEKPLDGFRLTLKQGEITMPLDWAAGDIRFRDKATANVMAMPLTVMRIASAAYDAMRRTAVDISNKHNLHHEGATEQLYKIIGSLHDKALAFSQRQLQLDFGPDFKLQPQVITKLEKSLHFRVNWGNPNTRTLEKKSNSQMTMNYIFNPDKSEDFAAAVAYIKYIDENFEYIVKEMKDWCLQAQDDVNQHIGEIASNFRRAADATFKDYGYPTGLQESKKRKKFRFKVKRRL